MESGQQEFFTGPILAPALVFVRSQQARRYRLTLRRDGVAVATIPVRGSEREAARFVEQHRSWLEKARARQARRPRAAENWPLGATVLWRGRMHEIRDASTVGRPQVCLGADLFPVRGLTEVICGRRSEATFPPARAASNCRRGPAELAAETGVDLKQHSGPQPAFALGLLFGAWKRLVELAADPDAGRGARLHHLPRIDAPAGDESLAAVLGAGGQGVCRLARGRALAQAPQQPARALEPGPGAIYFNRSTSNTSVARGGITPLPCAP